VLAGTYQGLESDLHPAGDRLLISHDVAKHEQFILVTNWFEVLLERMGN
jgi:hypothetical protein